MYSDKPSVNLLTAALAAYGIRHIVHCPGARNAILGHNFALHPALTCHPVTDERSAAFIALGMALRTRQPVVVCLTSGSAILNAAPAVAEAFYQQVPLIVISADRPAAWIDQNDGQTLQQAQTLLPWTAQVFTLPEVVDDQTHAWSLRTLHAAMLRVTYHRPTLPIHINIPLTEPLFSFTTQDLPTVLPVLHLAPTETVDVAPIVERIKGARFPVLLIGQHAPGLAECIATLGKTNAVLILPEVLANAGDGTRMAVADTSPQLLCGEPDLVLYVGGMFIGKGLKTWIRNHRNKTVIRIGHDTSLIDTLQDINMHVACDGKSVLQALAKFCHTWQPKEAVVKAVHSLTLAKESEPCIRHLGLHDCGSLQTLANWLSTQCAPYRMHLANSSMVRNAALLLGHLPTFWFCNRGVNGIEGSLSATVGYNVVDTDTYNYCLIGDLSFFYDQNALWNKLPKAGLRIFLCNNDGGQIHRRLSGLQDSPALDRLIVATHHTSARHTASTHHLHYQCADTYEALDDALATWLELPYDMPALIEVNTDNVANSMAVSTLTQHYTTFHTH